MSTVRLHIKICNGQNLLTGSKGYPYTYVTLNLKSNNKKSKLKTEILPNAGNPIWKQEFDLVSLEPENDLLILNMYDEDIAKDEKMMDELSFPVTKWKIGDCIDHISQELKLKKKNAGTLNFEVQAFDGPEVVKKRDVVLKEPKSSGVRVHIKAFEAKNVLRMDIGGRSDPYLLFSINNKKKTKVRTNIISNTINPIWNQELDITTNNRNKDILVVQMYDDDICKDERMCNAIEISLKDHPIGSHYIFNDEIKLREKKAGHLHFELDFFEHKEEPEVIKKEVILSQPCKLHVRVREGHNLKKMDIGGKSDLYITFALKGNKDKKAIQETQIISNTFDPIWNQDLIIQIPDYNTDVVLCNMYDDDGIEDEEMMDELMFTIKDWRIGQHVVFDQPIKLKKEDAGSLLMEFNLLNIDDPIPGCIAMKEGEINSPSFPCHLDIHVFEGNKFKKMDQVGKPSPYLTFQVKGTKKESIIKTQIISNSCNPIWNQNLFLNVEDYSTAEVLVNMFNDDIKMEDKMMNEQVYKLSEFSIGENKVFNEEIKLKKKRAGCLHYEFTIVKGLHSQPNKPEAPNVPCKLVVTAVKGTKLLMMDISMCYPYITCNLKSEKEKKKTKIISNTNDPIWKESFVFFVKDMTTEVLLVNMMNEDITKDNKMMNQLEFPLDKWKIGSHISYDEDIKLKKKAAGHLWLEFDILDPNDSEENFRLKYKMLEEKKLDVDKNKDELEQKIRRLTEEKENFRLKYEMLEEKKLDIDKNKDELEQKIRRLTEENENINDANIELRKQIQELEKSKKKSMKTDIDEIKFLDDEMLSSLKKGETIGRGATSKVIEVVKEQKFALKVMTSKTINENQFKHFLGEYEILNSLNHPNIIKSFGINLYNGKEFTRKSPMSKGEEGKEEKKYLQPIILLEYCPRSLIKEEIEKMGKLEKIKILYEIVEGMICVHSKGIIHRDLKPENILIDMNGRIKISDFGISTLASIETQTKGVGTIKFMAPELLNEKEHYSEKVDNYAFGVLMYFILTNGEHPKISIIEVGNGKKAPIPNSINSISKSLIEKCWSFSAEERPSFIEIREEMKRHEYELISLTNEEKREISTIISRNI